MRKAVFLSLILFLLFESPFAKTQPKNNTLVRSTSSLNKMWQASTHSQLFYRLNESYFTADVEPISDESDDFFQMPGEFERERKDLKSPSTAALLSLLVPGAGEIYAGAENKGKIFILSEASLWAGFFGFRTYSSWLKDDYRNYAASHAQVNLDDKSDSFFDELSFYDSRDQYNQFAPLYNRGEKQAYPETDFWYWQWDSRESRLRYREMKNRSKDMSRRAIYMVGLSIVNRVVSVVDALRTVKSYNRKKGLEFSQLKFDMKANPLGSNPSVLFHVSHKW